MTTTLMTPTTSADLVDVLTPQVERLYERHLATTKSWLPHELVPWERATESKPRGAWDPASSSLSSGVRSALVVNLLTEDNLPYYFETINRVFANETWREWARRWTAEEMRHGIVIRDYITVTHAVATPGPAVILQANGEDWVLPTNQATTLIDVLTVRRGT